MKKFALLVAAGALSTAALALPSPAAGSCHEVIEGGGCIENAICGAVYKVPVVGDRVHCID